MTTYHATPSCIANSEGRVCQEPPYLDWLLGDTGAGPRVFYDLDASVAAILRLIELTKDEGQKLYQNGKLHISPYQLTYYPRRFFSIAKGFGAERPYMSFSHIGQYTDTHFEPDYSPEYAIAKAREGAEVAQNVTQAFKALGLPTDKLTSPIAAYEHHYLGNLKLPTIDDVPEGAAELAYQAVKGNWLEAYQAGYWPQAYDYDLNGAYGNELARLLDTRRGNWLRSPERPDGAKYGFAQGVLTTQARFHPFLIPLGDMTYTPVGSWETTLTLQELDFLNHYQLGQFDITDAWWWTPQGQQYELLKGVISWLWDKRQNAQGLGRDVVKRIMAGIWGRFLEVRGTEGNEQFGPNFNSIYGAIVEANSRLRVAGATIHHGITPLQVAVDGMITDRPLPLELGEELGSWRLSHEGKCIIISSGVVGFEGKQGAEEFSLRFSWLLDQLSKKPRAQNYKMSKWSPVTLALALHDNRLEELGQIEQRDRSIYLDPDPKRCWLGYPKTGGQVLRGQFTSEPWEYGMVTGYRTLRQQGAEAEGEPCGTG